MKEEVRMDDAEQVICPLGASAFYTQVQPYQGNTRYKICWNLQQKNKIKNKNLLVE